jgi:hypothetical protein
MLLFLAAALVEVVGLSWVTNPYGRWQTSLIDSSFRPRADPCNCDVHERAFIPYRLRTERPSHLLVGSSRMLCGTPIEPRLAEGFLNAGLTGATIGEIAMLLDLATTNHDLRRVVWGIDFYAFSAAFPAVRDPELRRRLRAGAGALLLDAQWTLPNLGSMVESVRVLTRLVTGGVRASTSYPAPWPEAVIAAQLGARDEGLQGVTDDVLRQRISGVVGLYENFRFSPAAFDAAHDAIARVRQAGVETTLVVFPNTLCELEVLRRMGLLGVWLEWKRALLAAVGPYWDFSGYNDAARSEALYADLIHLRPPAGHVVLRHVLGRPCNGCGELAERLQAAAVWVDRTTIDGHLAAQARQPETAAYRESRCTTEVEAVFNADPALATQAAGARDG